MDLKYSDWARSQSLFLSDKQRNRQAEKQTNKETDKEKKYNTRGKKTEKEKDHVKEHEIFRRGGQSENKVTKSSVSHPIPLQFFSNLESREVFQSCRKLAED